jgi:hypothetical protein
MAVSSLKLGALRRTFTLKRLAIVCALLFSGYYLLRGNAPSDLDARVSPTGIWLANRGMDFGTVTFSKDGLLMAGPTEDDRAMGVWSLTDGKSLHRFDVPNQLDAKIAFSDGGRLLAFLQWVLTAGQAHENRPDTGHFQGQRLYEQRG